MPEIVPRKCFVVTQKKKKKKKKKKLVPFFFLFFPKIFQFSLFLFLFPFSPSHTFSQGETLRRYPFHPYFCLAVSAVPLCFFLVLRLDCSIVFILFFFLQHNGP